MSESTINFSFKIKYEWKWNKDLHWIAKNRFIFNSFLFTTKLYECLDKIFVLNFLERINSHEKAPVSEQIKNECLIP